jgi:hypothetical protein
MGTWNLNQEIIACGRAGEFLDILEKEKVLSELFLRDQIWGFVKVLRELLLVSCKVHERTGTRTGELIRWADHETKWPQAAGGEPSE